MPALVQLECPLGIGLRGCQLPVSAGASQALRSKDAARRSASPSRVTAWGRFAGLEAVSAGRRSRDPVRRRNPPVE